MICPHCEFEIKDNLEICPYCQSFVIEEPKPLVTQKIENVNDSVADFSIPSMSKKEFWQLIDFEQERKEIRVGAILFYIPGIASLFAEFYMKQSFDAVVFIAVLYIIGLTLGIQFAKSRACVILLGGYWILNAIAIQMMTPDSPGLRIVGTTNIIIMLNLLLVTFHLGTHVFNMHNAWKAYQGAGILPRDDHRPR